LLNRESAYQELQNYRTTTTIAQLRSRMAPLRDDLGEIAWAWLDQGARGSSQLNPLRHRELMQRWQQVNDEERQQIWAALFPRIAVYVEAAWQLHRHLPYQTYGKPFRSASSDQALQESRNRWMSSLLRIVGEYEQEITWYAAWPAYLWQDDVFSLLLAGAISLGDAAGEEVYTILEASVLGEHPIGSIGGHVIQALLIVDRPEGWQLIENLLVAAQRQEGLRQTIFQAISQAHPQVFRRFLRLILEQDLTRFSATIQAANGWFGFQADVSQRRQVEQSLQSVLGFLEQPGLAAAALASDHPQQVYLALWAIAFDDALVALAAAEQLLTDPAAERRQIGVWMLGQLQLPEGYLALLPMLADPDLEVAAEAFSHLRHTGYLDLMAVDLFERLEALLERIPQAAIAVQSLPWLGERQPLTQTEIIDTLVQVLDERSPRRLIPYLPLMSPHSRVQSARLLAEIQPQDAEIRQILLDLAGDRATYVRETALELLQKQRLQDGEAQQLETLLTRKAGDLRRGILRLLLNQADQAALDSAQRLLNSAKELQRLAGLELLAQITSSDSDLGSQPEGQTLACQALAEQYRSQHAKLSTAETELLDQILATAPQAATLENALGLIDPAQRTWPNPPVAPTPAPILVTPAAQALLASLDQLIDQQRSTLITDPDAEPNQEAQLLGNIGYLPLPLPDLSWQENLARLPLAEVWLTWLRDRPAELRDRDGRELWRAIAAFGGRDYFSPSFFPGYFRFSYGGFWNSQEPQWVRQLKQQLVVKVEPLKYPQLVDSLLNWFLSLETAADQVNWLLDAAEYSLAMIREAANHDLSQAQPQTADEPTLESIRSQFNLPAGMELPPEMLSPFVNLAAGNFEMFGSDFEPDLDQEDQDESANPYQPRLGSANLGFDWRQQAELLAWLYLASRQLTTHPTAWQPEQIRRLWHLLRWLDQPTDSVPRYRFHKTNGGSSYELATNGEGIVFRQPPELAELMAAFTAGVATEADLIEHLLGERTLHNSYNELKALTQRKPHQLLTEYPALKELSDRCRDRILEVELSRGDLPTAASTPALALSSIIGIPALIKVLQSFRQEQFVRGWMRNSLNRATVLSYLCRISFPAADDTPEAFAMQIRAANIPEQRLLELALYAPQWTRYVQQVLGWPALTEAVWWFHAHTKDSHWEVDREIRDTWTAQVREYTPLTAEDLLEGAVDVPWFWRVYSQIQPEQWQAIHEAAKYASGGQGHQRARLFADAMLGLLEQESLIKRIQDKRHQDSVRALGLLPLGSVQQQSEILTRYELFQEFLRTSRKFGSQRQASEKLAVRIGMENLARTAGYPDPQRLEWAMEAQAIADLARGPVSVTVDDVTVSLALDAQGQPQISTTKAGKALKAIPAKLKKQTAIAQLQERKQSLSRQGARMRSSLEAAMCRGDEFTAAELQRLFSHPILKPMLQTLVFGNADLSGYPVQNGTGLANHAGAILPLSDQSKLRILHPVDLVATGEWHLWQQECFASQRRQPFKQVFRELYVLTAAEQTESKGSCRYAGQQVNPSQALALLGKRGWVTDPEAGVRRTFHDHDLSVWISFQGGCYTPAEVEGLTLEEVYFCQRSQWQSLALNTIPSIVFSEVMRDLDLVVSVAHQGGVDPEASASTVEMRSALVRETNRLLHLENVSLKGNYALIAGTLGNYSVHLGSGVVHRQPGGAVCIIPVHGQHRGRLFLPFSDDDPKTAEVISKVLLLAKDSEIKDPTILAQIR
jgi:hypothetical protein